MATAFPDSEELKANFEKVLLEKIRQHNSDVDESLASYICSIVSDEETPDEDKAESIEPILQELNQNGSFDESQMAKEIIESWNKMKIDFDASESVKKSQGSNEPDTLSTISSMIKSHEKKTEIKKKTNVTGEYGAIDGDEDDDQEEASCSLPSNTNAQNAAAVEKARRDKIAQAHIKQKEQTKKAAIDHAAKEEEKKKKAKEKVAKQERRR